jgi:hypothetical protein
MRKEAEMVCVNTLDVQRIVLLRLQHTWRRQSFRHGKPPATEENVLQSICGAPKGYGCLLIPYAISFAGITLGVRNDNGTPSTRLIERGKLLNAPLPSCTSMSKISLIKPPSALNAGSTCAPIVSHAINGPSAMPQHAYAFSATVEN